MRRTIGPLASGLALVAALSACGGDPAPRFEAEPSAEPTTASPSASAEPEPWEERTDDGAVAFVEHWIDVFDVAKEDGDTAMLLSLSSPDCQTCQNFAETTEDIYARGGSLTSNGWKVRSISEPIKSDRSTLIAVDVLQTPQEVRRSESAKPEKFEGGRIDLAFTLAWANGAWTVKKLEAVQ